MDIDLQPPPLSHRQQGDYPPPPPPPPPAPGYGQTFVQSCLVAGCATVLAPVVLILGLMLCLYLLASRSIGEATGSLESIYQAGAKSSNLRERILREGNPSAWIVLVTVHGTIDGDGSPLEGNGILAYVSEQLREAGDDDRVLAVIMQIDSPGGGLTASDQLYNEVRELRSRGKKVIAWAGSMMASGGYYIAAGAEGIMASPTSTVGSIGVVMRYFEVAEMLKKLGIRADPIVSGERKDIGSPFRAMTEGERKLLQEYIDASHRRFVKIVADGRNLTNDQAADLADGRIYTADEGLANGLVDRIGYIKDAIAWAEELADAEDMRVVTYRRPVSFSDFLREAGRGAAEGALEAANNAPPPRAMAVWEQ